ncbi:formate dehydrogenase subunit gamma [Rhodospirillaceae bacterium SYSU D60014]|uniref:formate dehydrogenase subunit gamma n=1 Tax=Virgifigura deserti TaxID=2268457 RepID=UPI000E6669BB
MVAISNVARMLSPLFVVGMLLLPPQPAAAQEEANPNDRTGVVNDAFRGPIATDNSDLIRDRWHVEGVVNLPDEKAGVLVQSEGRVWRRWHNEEIVNWGAWTILGFTLLLFLFVVYRGRIPLRSGFSGRTILRFNGFERTNHWMTAGSFILVALTGLIILYGQLVLKPLIGAEAYSTVALWSAYIHMAFVVPFVIGAVVMAVMWTRRNIPRAVDWQWLKRGGGFLPHGPHRASAYKFNAGQKLIFWSVILGGLVLLASGLSLMFPFFWLGVNGMQWAQVIHAAAGLLMTAIIIGHIWIGTIGMVGAIDAMWGGQVDRNWAEEHHDLWVDELEGRASPKEAGR